jgi:hypothetical protein
VIEVTSAASTSTTTLFVAAASSLSSVPGTCTANVTSRLGIPPIGTSMYVVKSLLSGQAGPVAGALQATGPAWVTRW